MKNIPSTKVFNSFIIFCPLERPVLQFASPNRENYPSEQSSKQMMKTRTAVCYAKPPLLVVKSQTPSPQIEGSLSSRTFLLKLIFPPVPYNMVPFTPAQKVYSCFFQHVHFPPVSLFKIFLLCKTLTFSYFNFQPSLTSI